MECVQLKLSGGVKLMNNQREHCQRVVSCGMIKNDLKPTEMGALASLTGLEQGGSLCLKNI